MNLDEFEKGEDQKLVDEVASEMNKLLNILVDRATNNPKTKGILCL